MTDEGVVQDVEGVAGHEHFVSLQRRRRVTLIGKIFTEKVAQNWWSRRRRSEVYMHRMTFLF